MGTIIKVDFQSKQVASDKQQTIDLAKVSASRRRLTSGLIKPAETTVEMELAGEHTADPIKSIEDIERISTYLVTNKRYRDNMLFVVGINLGLRASDLVTLRFCHLIDEHFSFRDRFPILEKKTKNTRSVRKNRYLTINEAVMDAVELYLQYNDCKLDDYMFRSESNRGGSTNEPLRVYSVERILKGVAAELQINCHVSTHTLRKTFGYHQMVMSGNDPRKLLLLQKIYGHSSAAQTLDYIGITSEEIDEAYLNLNLAGKNCYSKFAKMGEDVTA